MNEIVGFLGENGAGKTTTLNMITNYISQSSGKIIINGKDICCQKPSEKKIIGYLPENPPLYFDMTVQEYLNYVCELKKADKKRRLYNGRLECTYYIYYGRRKPVSA